MVIGVSDPELPDREVRHGAEYFRIPFTGWRRWLYRRYRRYFPLYDQAVAQLIAQVQPDLLHVHNRPLLAHYLKERCGPTRSSSICTTSTNPWENGRSPSPVDDSPGRLHRL